jgi:hypothetical protein
MALTIITRSQWGAAFPASTRTVPLSQRRFFVAHWPGSSGRVADEMATVRAIERQHRNQGWSAAPGYNFLVGMSGRVYEGAGQNVQGVHCPGRNTDGFGVCFLQGMSEPFTAAAKASGRELYLLLNSRTGRTLTQTWHGAHFATGCPGNDIIAWVRAGMPGGSTPAPKPEPEPEPEPEPIPVSEATMFIRSKATYDGTNVRVVRYAVWDGPRTYWRRIRQGMIGDLERAGIPIIDDPNDSWLGDWRDGAPA